MTNIKTLISTSFLAILIVSFVFGQSGVNSLGNAYIHEDSQIGLHDNLSFNNSGNGLYPGIIMTNRNPEKPGVFAFGKNSSWDNANDFQHIDGYVKVFSNEAFTFPVGNLGSFKPVSISGAEGTLVAYFMDNPLKLSFIDNSIFSRSSSISSNTFVKVSQEEYWDIQGSNETQITLYWDINSNIQDLCNDDLSRLQIAGWNGSNWEIISSSVDDTVLSITSSDVNYTKNLSSVHNGSITTDTNVTPDDYDVFTFAIITDDVEGNNNIDYDSQLVDNESIQFTLFPNPTFNLGNVNIDYDLSNVSSDAYLEIYNVTGERLFVTPIAGKEIMRIPFNDGTSGIYHIGVVTEKGSRMFKPVVIGRQ